jgi:hypothetical protein
VLFHAFHSRSFFMAWLAIVAGPVGVLQTAQHAAQLNGRGYTVVMEPVITTQLVNDCAALCHSTLAALLADVEAAGCDPNEQMYRFRNICHRQRNRWDLLLPREATASWASLVDTVMAAATPIIRAAQGPAFTDVVPLMCGAVVSRPLLSSSMARLGSGMS